VDYYFIGEVELLTAFRFVGVDGCAVNSAEQALAAFKNITNGEAPYKILILSETVSDWLCAELTAWQLSGRYPLVVETPPLSGHIEGRKTLVDAIREAIGIHV
jgi:V/A-type H+-transporting ATPase subunit F